MPAEQPRASAYHDLVTKTEDLAYQGCLAERPDTLTLQRVVLAALHAYALGVSPDAISQALSEGVEGGILLYENVRAGGRDLDYWRAVRDEAEQYWHARSTKQE
ncbi:MAG: hypothetical protein JNJ61_12995 [Anaerolineae bacterium]|nr:hypothetical protein [Anaerolineae bacterium]